MNQATKMLFYLFAAFFISIVLFGVPAAMIARNKNFEPWLWLLSLGPLGLVVVYCLQGARKQGEGTPRDLERRRLADKCGFWLSAVTVIAAFGSYYVLRHVLKIK